ncbi:multifunctional CCA addition/repair protein [Candidatus Albibeggiatoa sp. nov. NOAA]|uniref:multifunctional CCA addition/repair protein n=1 Tax=Candidatus Albibeggiatoa sp. nov. NOAA TaxID=3162724 RepID=UPI0032F30E0D|nr:multifunctional CCA addition/repair protein [Thiotrichaceae bacterium]
MQVFKVGGAVRDRLLGRAVKDIDWVVVGTTVEHMQSLGFIQVGKDFPVFLHPKTKQEYALARTERKTGKGYTGFEVYAAADVSLEQDLSRRDLTINAMAEDEQGNIIDPFNGQQDLDNRLLRHVSPAFSEDPVRILRIARFAARYDFQIAPETMELMQEMVKNGEVDALVAERVWQEAERALGEAYPQRFIEVLRQCGALAVIFPEVEQLFGVPQRADYHPEVDTGIHLLLCLQQARRLTSDTQVIFAVLVHDLGKGNTPSDILPRHLGHEERGLDLLVPICKRLRIPKQYKELAKFVVQFHTHCHRIADLRPNTALNVLEVMDAFRRPQRFEQFLLACEADARGRKGLEHQPYPQAARFRRIFEAAQQVNVATIIADGFTGSQIKEQLHQRRIHAIKHLLHNHGDE